MKYIPLDVLDCVSSNLDIPSMMQIGFCCRDTKFLTVKAKKIVETQSLQKLKKIIQQMIDVNTTLSNTEQRHKIGIKILQNMNASPIINYIIDIVLWYYYQTKNDMYTKEFILSTLDKVQQKHVSLSTREQEVWELFQQFWLGDSYYVSVFISSKTMNCEAIFQSLDNNTIDITVLNSNTGTTNEHFQYNNIDGMLSFIWQQCGRKFFLELHDPTCQIVREYNVSKTPRSFEKLYHIYMHVQDIQQPFLQLVENMTKKIV
jgi:hypothetical protein